MAIIYCQILCTWKNSMHPQAESHPHRKDFCSASTQNSVCGWDTSLQRSVSDLWAVWSMHLALPFVLMLPPCCPVESLLFQKMAFVISRRESADDLSSFDWSLWMLTMNFWLAVWSDQWHLPGTTAVFQGLIVSEQTSLMLMLTSFRDPILEKLTYLAKKCHRASHYWSFLKLAG